MWLGILMDKDEVNTLHHDDNVWPKDKLLIVARVALLLLLYHV